MWFELPDGNLINLRHIEFIRKSTLALYFHFSNDNPEDYHKVKFSSIQDRDTFLKAFKSAVYVETRGE